MLQEKDVCVGLLTTATEEGQKVQNPGTPRNYVERFFFIHYKRTLKQVLTSIIS